MNRTIFRFCRRSNSSWSFPKIYWVTFIWTSRSLGPSTNTSIRRSSATFFM